MTAEFAVQQALFSALSALGLAVHDSAPQAADGGSPAPFPYVEIGAVVLAPWDTKDRNGFDLVARIHTRSRSAGMREAKLIQGQVYDRLHNGDLVLDGWSLVLMQRQTSDVQRVGDGSFHGVCEYRGLIEAAS